MTLIPTVNRDVLTPEQSWREAAELTTPLGQYLGKSLGQGFDESVAGRVVEEFQTPGLAPVERSAGQSGIARGAASMQARDTDRKAISQPEWRNSRWWRDGIPFQEGMTEPRAQALAESYDYRRWRDGLYQRYQGGIAGRAAGIAAQLLGSAASPENYIPILGPAARAAAAARFGRIAGPALVSGAEGAIGNLAVAPVVYPSLNARGEDLGVADLAVDIGFGALVGGAFGGLHGALSARQAMRERGRVADVHAVVDALNAAQASLARGEPVDVGPLIGPSAERAAARPVEFDGKVLPPGFEVANEADPAALSSWVKRSLAEAGNRLRLVVGRASQENVTAVRDGAGIDIDGYTHIMEQSRARHVDQKHGPASPEAKNGGIPVLPGDYDQVRQVLDQPDAVVESPTERGSAGIWYERKMGDGFWYYIQERRAGRKTLALETFYKRPNRDPKFIERQKGVGASEGPDPPGSAGTQGERPKPQSARPTENISDVPSASQGRELAPAYREPLDHATESTPDPHPSIATGASRAKAGGDELAELAADAGLDREPIQKPEPEDKNGQKRSETEVDEPDSSLDEFDILGLKVAPEDRAALAEADAAVAKADAWQAVYDVLPICVARFG